MRKIIIVNADDEIQKILDKFATTLPSLSQGNEFRYNMSRKLSENGNLVVLKDNDEDEGFIAFYANDYETKKGYITMVAVKPEYQGAGCGKVLMTYCCDMMKKQGMENAKLEVAVNNTKARAFYEHLGFDYCHEDAGGISLYMEKPL